MFKTNLFCLFTMVTAACGGDDGGTPDDNEVITTVALELTPVGGTVTTFEFDDADGPGGSAPVIDPITLAPGNYTLGVRFINRLEDPPEEITDEVNDENDQHQLFFTGTAVDGPASNHPGAPLAQAYSDTDVNGIPVGLANAIVATAGTGTLTVTLRHMPPINGTAVKVPNLADMVKSAGIDSIGGSTDASVSFMVTVQ
ncbi:MAG: hypothetical protein ABI867_30830 [Kofleriaceae bacterium]